MFFFKNIAVIHKISKKSPANAKVNAQQRCTVVR